MNFMIFNKKKYVSINYLIMFEITIKSQAMKQNIIMLRSLFQL